MLPLRYVTFTLGIDGRSYINISGVSLWCVIDLDKWFSNLGSRRDYLEGLWKPRLLGLTHRVCFSRCGAQECAFLKISQYMDHTLRTTGLEPYLLRLPFTESFKGFMFFFFFSLNRSTLESAEFNNHYIHSFSSLRCCPYPHNFKVLCFKYKIKSTGGQNRFLNLLLL